MQIRPVQWNRMLLTPAVSHYLQAGTLESPMKTASNLPCVCSLLRDSYLLVGPVLRGQSQHQSGDPVPTFWSGTRTLCDITWGHGAKTVCVLAQANY